MKEKKDIIRLVILKVGVALALSFAGFVYSRLNRKRPEFRQPPDSMCPSEERTAMEKTSEDSISVDKHEDTFRPRVAIDDNELETSSMLDSETEKAYESKEKEEYEEEIRYLRAMVGDLQEREKNLELQLLELYGLKEQESTLFELKKRLELSNMENKLVSLKIETLQEENRRLQEQVAGQAKMESELDSAREKIKLLKNMLKSETAQNKLQILKLRERVLKLQEQEAAGVGPDMKVTLEKMKNLEAELEELKKVNSELQRENNELAHKFKSTQVLADSVLEDPEREALQELTNQLRQEKEELEKKIEQLQEDRCTDIEELVYLRWINACLRYELRNFKPEHGKTVAKDLSKSLSPESEAKAKQLILEYAYTEGMDRSIDFDSDIWSSSHSSHVVDSDELSVSPKDHKSSKVKFFKKLRRLIRGKEVHFGHQNPESVTERTEDYDSGSERSFEKAKTESPDFRGVSFRRSMDTPRLKNPKIYETKDLEFRRRYSDIGSGSIHEHKRAFSERITGRFMSPESQSDQGSYSSEKSELKKFAEVLKESEKKRSKVRKSTSLGSLLGFKSSTPE